MTWQKGIKDTVDAAHWNKLEKLLNGLVHPSIKSADLINNYYLPLFFYLFNQKNEAGKSPYFIGINAPQGGGKTTLTSYLVKLFETEGIMALSLSIDDFYLRRKDQIELAKQNPKVRYLQQRGYPGTHDVQLGRDILSMLNNPGNNSHAAIPRYDKSRYQGQGDRIDKDKWPTVKLPVDVVLLEGWMLGFQSISPGGISDPQLEKINLALDDYSSWYQYLDCFIYIYPVDPVYVVDWRCEAEEKMKSEGLPGMSDSQVRQYAEMFLPAYELFGPELQNNSPVDAPFLKIQIGKNRLPVD